MGETEKHEEEFINEIIEKERQSSGEPEKKIGKIILEKTNVSQIHFDSMGNYFYEWD